MRTITQCNRYQALFPPFWSLREKAAGNEASKALAKALTIN